MDIVFISFNSRPHTEVDDDIKRIKKYLRSFQLTTSHGGRLEAEIARREEEMLSTHDLTRRSTMHFVKKYLLRSFQLTTSHGGRRLIVDLTSISEIFQLTTSHGGRHGWPGKVL